MFGRSLFSAFTKSIKPAFCPIRQGQNLISNMPRRSSRNSGDAAAGDSKRKSEKSADPAPASKKTKKETVPSKAEENGSKNGASTLMNRTESEFSNIDFTASSETKDGKAFNFKICSWNVGGIRSMIKKGGMAYFGHENPDIICLQETKCAEDSLPPSCKLEGYHDYWATGPKGNKDGYAGVGLYSKVEPLSVKIGLGIEKHDDEGRVITAEYADFYFIAVYVPNSGRGLVTLPKRLSWNKDFHSYIADLDKKKPVILAGDLNVSHKEQDLARPKNNTRSAGFTQEERDGFSELLSQGFLDSFRELYPDKKDAYTYWTYMANCRAKNVGWRLDYFVISERLRPKLCDNIIRSEVYGSDHCPLVLTMHM